MHPIVRSLGKLLRLVGISSPEDSAPKVQASDDPPSWRAAAEKTRPIKDDETGG